MSGQYFLQYLAPKDRLVIKNPYSNRICGKTLQSTKRMKLCYQEYKAFRQVCQFPDAGIFKKVTKKSKLLLNFKTSCTIILTIFNIVFIQKLYIVSKEENSMVELIVGKKGKGKTKVLLDKVNGAIKEANGSIVYLDKSAKHMYELNNKVRLIDVSGYPIKNADEFVGFVCGIISQDHDLEQIYLDSFLKVSKLEDADVTDTLDQLDKIGEKYGISIVVSISLDKEEIPEALQDKIAVAL